MEKASKSDKIYFIGIGGIGMSALARWFNTNGYDVAGYDRTRSELCVQLEAEGMNIHYSDDVNSIPDGFNGKEVLVVYTPAIPKEHKEWNYFIQQGNKIMKRAEVLGLITENVFTVAVAGTHGKTTTSSMIAHLLTSAGLNCFAFLGGITQNYKSNLLLGDAAKGKQIMVVEADEYDRSFLKLKPSIAIITAMDPDHLDIYKDENDFVETFNEFARQIKEGGVLIHIDSAAINAQSVGARLDSYGFEGSDYKIINYNVANGITVFDLIVKDRVYNNIRLQVPGKHNVMNATAAFGVGLELNVPVEEIYKALYEFKGVKRRFDYIYKGSKVVYIDDYAHHPTEIKAFLSAVKDVYKGRKVTAIFQPHLFSRTRDFMEEFAESLALADGLILLDIYPAREKPIEGITSAALLDKIKISNKNLVSKDKLIDFVDKLDAEVIVTIGAGDIDQFIQPIKQLLENKNA